MWFKKKTINVQEKPFAFEPGKFYVMEYNEMAFELESIQQLNNAFWEEEINCVLIPNLTNRVGFHPVRERRVEDLVK